MMLVFYSDKGMISEVRSATKFAKTLAVKSGRNFIEVSQTPSADAYVNVSAKVIVEPPPLPSPAHYIDVETKQICLDFDTAKDLKWQEIKQARDQAEFGGFNWAQYQFDSDQLSQQRIASAVQLAVLDPYVQIDWTLADNTSKTFTGEQLTNIGKALAQHVTSVHDRGRILRDRIMCCDSPEQLEVITWQDKPTT